MDKDIIFLPLSTIEKKEEEFIDKYLVQSDLYNSSINFIKSHFTKEIQKDNFYKIKFNGYPALFYDIWWELWNNESYNNWKELGILMGDTSIFIIEDDYMIPWDTPGFNFNFPINTSWKEFTDWCYISATLLYENFYSYFVFWSSRNWLRYIETDGHRELSQNWEVLHKCNDYILIKYTNPEIEGILQELWFKKI